MHKFKVNDYISLQLEENKTVIYIAGEEFIQCKRLILSIPENDTNLYENAASIDEVAEIYDHYLFEGELYKQEEDQLYPAPIHLKITPEEEFIGHCSNLQVWAENNYNTRILRSDLAFPLLRRLSDAGDEIARKVFKEEIAKRIERGYLPVIKYLIEERYFALMNENEIEALNLENIDIDYITIFSKLLIFKMPEEKRLLRKLFNLEKARELERLDLAHKGFSELPENIGNLTNLKILTISNCKIKKLPNSIGNLTNLELLLVSNTLLRDLPESIINLKSLKKLVLMENEIDQFPTQVKNIKSLRHLSLIYNKINILPDIFRDLSFLESLDLGRNPIRNFPESLEFLIESGVKVKAFQTMIERIQTLEKKGQIIKKERDGIRYWGFKFPSNNNEVITLDKLEFDFEELKRHRAPKIVKRFVQILITHLTKTGPKIKRTKLINQPLLLLKQFYKKIGFRDIEQFKEFLEDLSNLGVEIAENNSDQNQQPNYHIKTLAEFWKSWICKTASKYFVFYYSIELSFGHGVIAFRTLKVSESTLLTLKK